MIKDKGKLENNEISKNPIKKSLKLDNVLCWKVVYYSVPALNFKSVVRKRSLQLRVTEG